MKRPDPRPTAVFSGTVHNAKSVKRRLSMARLDRLIAAATVDAYGDSEQRAGFLTMLEENLKLPFETIVLGVPVRVERIDLTEAEGIVAICRRGRNRQALPILNLSLPSPPPQGAEWIAAYRRWARGSCEEA